MAVFEIVLLCLGSALLGGGMGFYIARHGTAEARQNESLQQQLASNEQALRDYQDEVTTHFQESAELINHLTDAYRQVHNHIAQGASELTPTTLEEPLLKNMPDRDTLNTLSSPPSNIDITPPLDYAPKSATSQGMLDEAYGIEKTAETDADEAAEIIQKSA